MGFHSVVEIHALAEAMRHAYVDRNNALGDPEVVSNPIDRLTSKDYAARIRATIDPDKPTPSAALRAGSPPHEGTQTTHYSVVDGAGNAVAVTYTVNNWFGAAVVAPGTGFVLNDEMDDFTVKPGSPNLFGLIQGERNGIAPGKRPLSSMTPTLVLKDGKLVLVLGSPGGPRIITATLETIVNVIDHHMSLAEAVAAPRIHMQWLPDQIAVERGALDPAVSAGLEARGYKLVEQHPWSSVEAIAVAGSMLQGVNDPRRPGGAAVGF
jgi:gamma-glutamyltranspeptidase/glutathione hydrolase